MRWIGGLLSLALTALAAALLLPSSAVRAEAALIAPLPVRLYPYGIGVNPTTNWVYVTSYANDTVSVINGDTNTILGSPIQVGFSPFEVAVNPKANRIYVANLNGHSISVINGANNTIIGSEISVGSMPGGVAVNSATDQVYVSRPGSNTLLVIDGASHAIVGSPIPVGANAGGVAVNPITNRIYVANGGDDTVTVIDGATRTVVGVPIPVGDWPEAIGVNPNSNRIYVANSNDGTVTVIDGATDSVMGSPIVIGGMPIALAVNPAANRVYVTNSANHTMSIIDGATNAIIGSVIPVGSYPFGVAVDPLTNRTYVANTIDSTVSVVGVPFATPAGPTAPGLSATVGWSSLFAPSGSDFVGLYHPLAPNESPLSKRFTNGTNAPGGPGLGDGSISLHVPDSVAEGYYEVRLVSGASGATLARSRMQVRKSTPPVAQNDSYRVDATQTLTVPARGVLDNDIDPDSMLQSFVVSQPANGELSLNINGGFTYRPKPLFFGVDTFTYRSVDETGQSSSAAVTITVARIACGPRPSVAIQTSVVNGALQVEVAATDADGPTQNVIRELRFGTPLNGRITLAGQSRQEGFVHAPPAGTSRVTFTVQRVTAGRATTIPLTVVDACGEWPTFVGGGPDAGF